MNTQPEVAVVIPTYNCAELLRAAIASVVAQTFENWQVIVINNHSDDHTAQVVDAFADARIQLVNFRNEGVIAASRNLGIRLATAPWTAFLDSDDTWEPTKLATCLLELKRTESDIVVHDVYLDFEGRYKRRKHAQKCLASNYRALLFAPNDFVNSAVIARTELLRAAAGFSEDPALITVEDFDLWLRLVRDGARVAHVPEILGTILISNASASRAVSRHTAANLALLDKHFRELTPSSLIDRLRLRRARSLIWYGGGRVFQRRGEFAQAAAYFRHSFKLNPCNLRLFAALFLAFLPNQHTIKHRLA